MIFAIDFHTTGENIKWRLFWYMVLIMHWESF